VFDLSGVGGFNPLPPLVDDDPPLVTAKFGLGVGFDPSPLGEVQNPNLSLRS